MTLSLNLLGTFELSDERGETLDISAKKARALLTWLALNPGETHVRSRVAAIFWADSDEVAARHSLRQTLAALRRVLGAGVLASGRDTLSLHRDAFLIDTVEFERLLDEETPGALERACQIYRGNLLDGFRPHAAPFEEWLAAERARLHERALDAMDRLLATYVKGGDAGLAIPLATRLLAFDAVRESAHRALMQLHARRGSYTRALQQYQVCVSALKENLGVEPAAATRELCEEIVASRTRTPATPGPELTSRLDQTPQPKTHESISAEVRHAVILDAGLLESGGTPPERTAESTHDLLSRFHAAVDAALTRFDATVLSRTNETVRGAFGLPRARTNDAERALLCALAIHEALAKFEYDGLKARARISLAAGSVVVSRLEGAAAFTVTGTPADACARLLARAGPSEVLIDRAVRDELPASYRATRVGGRPPGWKVSPTPVSNVAELRFVGRVTERNRFAAALEASARLRRGSVFLVRGEAGIGKTRLLGEFRRLASDSGFDTLLTRALDYGAAIGHETMPTLVRELMSVDADASRRGRLDALERVRADGTLALRDEMYLFDLLGLPLPELLDTRFRALEHATRQRGRRRTIARLLEARASVKPVMLGLEDAHWADAATLRLIGHLAAMIERLPVVIVVTLRAGDEPADSQWHAALAGIESTVVEVPPLQKSEARELATTTLGIGADSRVERLIDRAGGNPLFLEQLLRTAHDDRHIPDSVQNLASARLDRLQRRDRIALQAASTLGERFSLPVLQHLIDDTAYDPAPLIAEHLVRTDGAEMLFGHVLIRDGIYETLLASQRRVLHQRAAGWYALRDTVLHAEQLDRAGDPNAVAAYQQAAAERAAAFHYQRALQLIERARAIAIDPEINGDLEAERGRLLQAIGEIELSIEAFETALKLATTPSARCRALVGIAGAMRITGQPEQALTALGEAQELAEALGDRVTLARIHHLRGNVFFVCGDPANCQEAHVAALTLARRIGMPELEAMAEGGLGDAAFAVARYGTAHTHFNRYVALCEEHGLDHLIAAGLAMRGHSILADLRLVDAQDDFEAAHAAATLVENLRDQWCARMGLGSIGLYAARLGDAAAHFEDARRLARKLGATHLEYHAAGHCAWMVAREGNRARAEQMIEEMLAATRRDESFEFCGAWLLGALAHFTSDPGRRLAALAEGNDLIEAGQLAGNVLAFHYFASESCLECGDWSGAKHYADYLEHYARAEPSFVVEMTVNRVRILCRHGRGERSMALAAAAREWLDACRAAGCPYPGSGMEKVADCVLETG